MLVVLSSSPAYAYILCITCRKRIIVKEICTQYGFHRNIFVVELMRLLYIPDGNVTCQKKKKKLN